MFDIEKEIARLKTTTVEDFAQNQMMMLNSLKGLVKGLPEETRATKICNSIIYDLELLMRHDSNSEIVETIITVIELKTLELLDITIQEMKDL
jgi:hypothetical protein